MSEIKEEKKVSRARPQSMIAQNFSLALDNVFGLDETFQLGQAVEDKKWLVNTQSAELQALEARLRATEERLRAQKGESPVINTHGDVEQEVPLAEYGPSNPQARQAMGATTQSRPGTAVRPGTAGQVVPPAGKKPVVEEDSEDEEDSEEDEEDEEDEEGSSSEESSEDERKK